MEELNDMHLAEVEGMEEDREDQDEDMGAEFQILQQQRLQQGDLEEPPFMISPMQSFTRDRRAYQNFLFGLRSNDSTIKEVGGRFSAQWGRYWEKLEEYDYAACPTQARDLICALEHNTFVRDIEIDLQILQRDTFQSDTLLRLHRFLTYSNQMNVLRLRISTSTKPEIIRRFFDHHCLQWNLKELHLIIAKLDQPNGYSQRLLPIAKFIAQSKNLERLYLRKEKGPLDRNDIDIIAYGVQHNRTLCSIDFRTFMQARDKPTDDLKSLFTAISKHPTISSVSMTESCLSNCYLFLEETKTLQNLSIRYKMSPQNMTPDCIQRFTSLLLQPTCVCTHLCLEGTNLSGPGIQLFAAVLRVNKTLDTICFENNELNDKDSAAIADALVYNNTLKCLRFLENDMMGDLECAQSWKQMLSTNKTLEELDISSGLCLNGLSIFLEGLANNHSLKRLALEECEFKGNEPSAQEACELLGDCLNPSTIHGQQCQLTELKLRFLLSRDKYWVKLAEALRYNTLLEKLEMHYVDVGDETIRTLSHSLTYNTTLKVLDIEGNDELTEDGMRSFHENVRYMRGLQEFQFTCGDFLPDWNDDKATDFAKQLAAASQQTLALKTISYMEELNERERFYLDLNGNGRYFLSLDDMKVALWPHVLSRLTKPSNAHLLYYFLRSKPELMTYLCKEGNNTRMDDLSLKRRKQYIQM